MNRILILIFVIGFISCTSNVSEFSSNELAGLIETPADSVIVDSVIAPLIVDSSNFTFKEFYQNGEIFYQVNIKNGLQEGWLKAYHPNGELMEATLYEGDVETGVGMSFFQNGIVNSYYCFNSTYGGNPGTIYYCAEYDSNGYLIDEMGEYFPGISSGLREIKVNEEFWMDVFVARPPHLAYSLSIDDSIVPLNEGMSYYSFDRSFQKPGEYEINISLKLTDKLTGETVVDTLRVIEVLVSE